MRETNNPELLLTRRNAANCLQNWGRLNIPGEICKRLGYWADGDRRIGGVNLIWAPIGNCGNQSFDVKREIQEAETSSMRVPKQSAGADQLVLVKKCL